MAGRAWWLLPFGIAEVVGVFEERRRQLRRQSDRELVQQVQYLRERRDGHTEDDRHRRRRAIRHHCAVSLSLRVAFSGGAHEAMNYHETTVKGRILDLSPTGCAVFTREGLAIGMEVGLVVHLDKGGDIPARGVVRWSKNVSAREGYANGVEFTKMHGGSRDIIAMFLKDLDENIGL